MNLRCLAYRALDRFRRTAVATKLIYHGVPVRTVQPTCTVLGLVTKVPAPEVDGDTTFDVLLMDAAESRHCEVTPCAPASLRAQARALRLGQIVELSGEERFDPAHLGGIAGWLEIHPVTSIIVKES